MDIKFDYEGASIKLIENNKEDNVLYLSLKEENNGCSHYYNFFVDNNENREGTIYIKNRELSPYYRKDVKTSPYIKTDGWNKMTEYYVNEKNELVIKVKPKTKQEISLAPRYIQKDLIEFLNNNNNSNMNISTNPIDEIIIGDTKLPAIVFTARQHPGETLSSFFMEGAIKEIINTPSLLNKYCFIIYPIVNKEGVAKGNHRITNGIDYNRSWNKCNPPKEIKYIKEQLKKYNIKFYIDVHNDEISEEDYIRTTLKIEKEKLAGIMVLKYNNKFKKFARAIIKQRKIINIFSKTADEYVFKKYHCTAMLIELSMTKDYGNIDDIQKKGKEFIRDLLGE